MSKFLSRIFSQKICARNVCFGCGTGILILLAVTALWYYASIGLACRKSEKNNSRLAEMERVLKTYGKDKVIELLKKENGR